MNILLIKSTADRIIRKSICNVYYETGRKVDFL